MLGVQPGGQTLWFKAGKYKVKKVFPRQKSEYIFDSDNSDNSEGEDSKKNEEGNTVLLYELPQVDSCEPLLPSFIAQKVSFPLEPSSNMHTLILDPPFETLWSDETEKRVLRNGQCASPSLVDGILPEFSVPNVDIQCKVTEEKEKEDLTEDHSRKNIDPIKRIPIWLVGVNSSFPTVSLILPALFVLVDFVIGLVLVAHAAESQSSLVSPFLFFFLGVCLPCFLVLYCLGKNTLWHSTAALHLTLVPTTLGIALIPFADNLFLLHGIFMMLLLVYILGDRRRLHVIQTTFWLHRDIREEDRRKAELKSDYQELQGVKNESEISLRT